MGGRMSKFASAASRLEMGATAGQKRVETRRKITLKSKE
jgi:hypothetical protein